jgi:hypothetical protein
MAKTNPTKRSTAAKRTTTKKPTARSKSKSAPTPPPKARRGNAKVGGSRTAAGSFGGKLDFGTPSKKAHPADHRVKDRRDRSPSQRNGPEGRRVVGVGAYGWNAGHSGGAADTDIIGVGTPGGSSVSTEGTLGRRKGKDLTTRGGAAPFASGRRSKSKPDENLTGKVGGDKRVRGGTTHNAAQGGAGGTGTGDYVDLAQSTEDQTINPLTGGPARRDLDENRS